MSIRKVQFSIVLLVVIVAFSWALGAQQSATKFTAEDYLEINALYNKYATYFDAGDGEKWAALWTEDGEFTSGRGPGRADDPRMPTKGTVALTRTGSTSGTRHFVANLVITPTATGAKGSCYLLLYTARTTPPSFVETAIYDDTLVKTAQGWRFKKRIVWRDDDDITPFKPKPQAARPAQAPAAQPPAPKE